MSWVSQVLNYSTIPSSHHIREQTECAKYAMVHTTLIQRKNIKYGGKRNNIRYMKFIYLHCGEETKLRDPRS